MARKQPRPPVAKKYLNYRSWLVSYPEAEPYRNALMACHLIKDEGLRAALTSMVREMGLEFFNKNISEKKWHDDPIEKIIALALNENGIPSIRNYPKSKEGERGIELDFHLPCKVSIEVKRYHTDRSMEVLRKNKNVILIQGQQAAITFRDLLGRKSNKELQQLNDLELSVSI